MSISATKLVKVLDLIQDETVRASKIFSPFASRHEGLAVIEEEFLEFRSAVFWGVDSKGNPSDPVDEAIQLGAMAVRFLVDCSYE
jgi:hypothetical protein